MSGIGKLILQINPPQVEVPRLLEPSLCPGKVAKFDQHLAALQTLSSENFYAFERKENLVLIDIRCSFEPTL